MSEHERTEPLLSLSKGTQQQPVGIITARWNTRVTAALETGALSFLKAQGFADRQCYHHQVPGSFELPLGVQYLAEHTPVQGIIALGCLIQGETPHFHYIADAVTEKLSNLTLRYHIPVSYGLLTVNNQAQAEARAGGEQGNKGEEAASAMLQMMELKHSLASRKVQAGFH